MTGNVLELVQGFATPAMISAATATLGLNEKQASSALGAAVTSVLGGALQKSNDAGVMTQIASLAGALTPDAGMFSNIAGMLGGGVPSSPLQILGNRFIGQVLGVNQAKAIAALASVSGISGKAASGLMTLAAPMALAAIRSKLGPTPSAASVASLLNQDRNLIAQAMPAPLRAMYGFANLAPAAAAAPAAPAAPTVAAAAAAAPVVAAPVVAAASAAAAAPAPAAAPVAAAATTATAPATAPAPAAATAPAVTAAPVVAAAPSVAATVAPVVAAASAPLVATAAGVLPASVSAPVAHTSSGHASAPAVISVKEPAVVAAAPVSSKPPRELLTTADTEASSSFPLMMTALILALLAGSWYWAFGGGREAVFGKPAAPKPIAAAPAAPAAPAPAAAAVVPAKPAAATPLVGQPGGIGLKYALPNGTSIEVAKNGVEQKLIEFITSSSEIDKKMWFDFDRLGFETGSTDVTGASRAQLDALAAILKSWPATKVKIGGYTDNQGDPQANMKLSDGRAKRVAEELVKLGVTADRLEAEGYGEQFPIGDNATPEGRAKNRRTALSVRAK